MASKIHVNEILEDLDVFKGEVADDGTNKTNLVLAWGQNTNGQLGLKPDMSQKGDVIARKMVQLSLMSKPISCKAFAQEAKEPKMIWLPDQLVNNRIISLATGFYHSLAADAKGHCFSWGGGENGTLGYGHEKLEQAVPRRILSLKRVKQVAVGRFHSLALTDMGKIFAWGSTKNGKLGLKLEPTKEGEERKFVREPKHIDLVKGSAMFIAAGQTHSMAITEKDKVWVWGANKTGQLGFDPTKQILCDKPTLNKELSGKLIKRLSCPFDHCVAIAGPDSEAIVYVWGKKDLLNRTSKIPHWKQEAVESDGMSCFSDAVAGCTHTVAIVEKRVYTWGASQSLDQAHVLGYEKSRADYGLTQKELTFPHDEGIIKIAAFQFHTVAIASDQKIFSWGAQGLSRLGRDITKTTPCWQPHLAVVKLDGFDDSKMNVHKVAVGYAQSLVLFTAHSSEKPRNPAMAVDAPLVLTTMTAQEEADTESEGKNRVVDPEEKTGGHDGDVGGEDSAKEKQKSCCCVVS